MKRIVRLMTVYLVVCILLAALGSANAAAMEGYMLAEIGGIEYTFYQESYIGSRSRNAMKYNSYDQDGRLLFTIYLEFDDGIRAGTFTTDDDPYNRHGVTVRLSDFSSGWGEMYEASFHEMVSGKGGIFGYVQGAMNRDNADVGWLEMIVENQMVDGNFYEGYFSALTVGERGNYVEIYGAFLAEV